MSVTGYSVAACRDGHIVSVITNSGQLTHAASHAVEDFVKLSGTPLDPEDLVHDLVNGSTFEIVGLDGRLFVLASADTIYAVAGEAARRHDRLNG